MCFSLPEKGSPYIVRKKHSEAENSEAENSEHLSEINESTSTLYTVCNPYIQYQNYQGYIQPQYHQHASFPGYIQPQYHQPASFLGYIYPHIQLQDQGWYKPPPLSAREKNCFTPAERDENERSFLEGERSYENEKKKFTADEWSEKKTARYAMRESYKPFRETGNWSANYDNRPPPAAPSNAPFVPFVSPVPSHEPRNYDHPLPPAAPIPFVSPAPISFVPFISPVPVSEHARKAREAFITV
jgi:hypothetical protein